MTATLMDYCLPRAEDVPFFHFETRNVPSTWNALGIKGAGEAGVIPGTAAIASAIEDAVGRRISSMPISPTELYDIVRSPDSEMTAAAGRRAGTGVMA